MFYRLDFKSVFCLQTVKRGKGSYIVVMSYYGENKNNSILLLYHVKKPVFLIYPP